MDSLNKTANILVTGGSGYIGCHTLLALLNANYVPVVIDNLSNSSIISIKRVEAITNKKVKMYIGDIRDGPLLEKVCIENNILGVIHLAGLKAVGESCQNPISYYDNNVSGTLVLLEVMERLGITNLVFSSSATVYGGIAVSPITENSELSPTNPYGKSKLFIEKICNDLIHRRLGKSVDPWKIALLRYFNPIGADKSGLIGEDPSGIPNNIMPFISQVAIGRLDKLRVFGNDYPTKDGTGVRDYIHVSDLADGHVCALSWILSMQPDSSICKPINLGRGQGVSVLELIKTFELETGVKVPFEITPRRPGDIATCFADPSLAKSLFGWQAKRSIKEMVSDSWNWQRKNPNGYNKNLDV